MLEIWECVTLATCWQNAKCSLSNEIYILRDATRIVCVVFFCFVFYLNQHAAEKNVFQLCLLSESELHKIRSFTVLFFNWFLFRRRDDIGVLAKWSRKIMISKLPRAIFELEKESKPKFQICCHSFLLLLIFWCFCRAYKIYSLFL